MRTNTHTPSINIQRDENKSVEYIPTQNANSVFNQIISNFQKGSRSFSIIGSYGTGKSAFVVALEKSLLNKNQYFDTSSLPINENDIEIINIIGEHASLISSVAGHFQIEDNGLSPAALVNEIAKPFQSKGNRLLVLAIDEFGKFLEFAAKNNPERELYFIQQLAEMVNDKDKDILFLTVLHKNFNAYALDLSSTQIDEWNKVKGRLVELNFNEPVEQLLYLASKKIGELSILPNDNQEVKQIHEVIKLTSLFPLRDFNTLSFSRQIYPFDLLSASVLTLALQEYAQNERSLFSFIENDDEFGLFKYDHISNPFYNVACVYDYLNFYHFSFLSTKYNPHLNQWNSIKHSIERVEAVFESKADDAIKLLKTIGLLNLFSKKGGHIDNFFLDVYGTKALGIDEPLKIIDKLTNQKIIHFTKYDKRYKILNGTDLDFELAINEAGRLIERIKDVTQHLSRHFSFPAISAKRVSYEKGTPRFFEFEFSENPLNSIKNEEADGLINLIFNKDVSESIIRSESKKTKQAILHGWFTKSESIEDTIYEIEKIAKVIEKNAGDAIAVQELNKILAHYKNLLDYYVFESLYQNDGSVKWFFHGEEKTINNQREFNQLLSDVCNRVYPFTPRFRNELVNKSKISATVSTARRKLLNRLLEEDDKIDFGFEDQKFPAEKTIFLAMIKSTGMYSYVDSRSIIKAPEEESFQMLWRKSYEFFEQTISSKKTIQDFIDGLIIEPFKLKQGFVDFWIPLFLIANKNDFALFEKNRNTGELTYIPFLNDEVFDLMNKSPQDYLIKKFDFSGQKKLLFNKYREILNQIEREDISNKTFIETLRPFLVFYKSLPEYTKNTTRLSEPALRLRASILNSTDPEESFFTDFPDALGFDFETLSSNEKQMEEFAVMLRNCIHEINSAYDHLVNEIEEFINEEVIGDKLDFPDNKEQLKQRYKNLRKDLIKPKQKVFYNRIVTLLDDRKSWINSICQACIGKGLESIADEDIPKLKHEILENIRELDNYTEMSKDEIDPDREEVIKLEVTSFLKGLSKKFIRIPKRKIEKIHTLEKSFKEQLDAHDKSFNIALLTKLLQDELNDEKN
jgi:hypothetical protein